jgi:integrase/recombinase XerD
MKPLDASFEQFLRERLYLKNVSPRTVEWYRTAWKALKSSSVLTGADSTWLSRTDLNAFVVHLRQRGVRPVTCNTWIGAMNAYCAWAHEQGLAPEAVKIKKLRLERRLLRTFDDAQIRMLLRFKPASFPQSRVHVLACSTPAAASRNCSPLGSRRSISTTCC